AQLRFGVGAGEINTIGEGEVGLSQDGSAWPHDGAAIEDVEQRQQHRADISYGFRYDDAELATTVNIQLVLGDHILSRLKTRERRLCRTLLLGATQQQAARM